MAHEELKKQYEEDKLVYEKPWELWQFKPSNNISWLGLGDHPKWRDTCFYRRKPEDKKLAHSHDESMKNYYHGAEYEIVPKGHKHAKLMIEYAKDAMENEEPWKLWEMQAIKNGKWIGLANHPTWRNNNSYRRKQKYIDINGFQVPEPERNELNIGEIYYLASIGSGSALQHEWNNDNKDLRWLKSGLLHKESDSAKTHVNAVLSFTKNT